MRYALALLAVLAILATSSVGAQIVSSYERSNGTFPTDCDFTATSTSELSSNLNSHRVLCIREGDYRSLGRLTFNRSACTSGSECWVIHESAVTDMANFTHPKRLSPVLRVRLSASDVDADYYNFYGISWEASTVGSEDSGNNVNQVIVVDAGDVWFSNNSIEGGSACTGCGGTGSGIFHTSGNRLTVQYNFLGNTGAEPNLDFIGVFHNSLNGTGPWNDTRIVGNEFKDIAGDSYQLQDPDTSQIQDLIIADNAIYLTSAAYTNCLGTLSPSGDCSFAENAWDFKSGGLADGDILVIGNVVYGYKPTDDLVGSSGSSGPVIQMHTGGDEANMRFVDNVVYNIPYAFWGCDSNSPGISVHNMLVANTDEVDRGNGAFRINDAFCANLELYGSTFIGLDQSGTNDRWYHEPNAGSDSDVKCNVCISSGDALIAGTSSQMDETGLYDGCSAPEGDIWDHSGSGAGAANNDTVRVNTKPISSPGTFVDIANAATTSTSPHFDCSGATYRTGYGDDDVDPTNMAAGFVIPTGRPLIFAVPSGATDKPLLGIIQGL